MYLNSIFKSLSRFSYIKKNFSYENLQDVEIITRDYWGSLRNILKSFSNHKINLTDIEPLKLSRTHKGQNIVVKLTFEKVEDKKYNELIFDLQQRYDQVLINNDMSVPSVPWYPRTDEDLKTIGTIMEVNEENNQDHPQFKDLEYRKRREEIAKLSQAHLIGEPVPYINYTEQEEQTWKKIYTILREKVNIVMSQRYLNNLVKIENALGFKYKIPQLRDIDAYLRAETGFRIKATHGILSQREFLNALGHRVFCCTQYIRHHSTPEYTPEPDIVHELVGHVPLFADKEVADLSQEIGILSCGAKKQDLSRLGTLYWFTLEFGAYKENGLIKGYGAGIASSIGECDHFPKAKYEKFDPFIHADRSYPIQTVQPTYMYTESFDEAMQSLIIFGKSLQKPFGLYYDFIDKELKSTRRIKTHLNDQ
ncbi:unnamed protein product [Paramecium primaurelia]|uniref:phenylalanine 4-monooxygenase n=2 Tax=Paramecium TaxID=5884 RepID=A0A8S1XBA0_9CILI|nr:unnamed protein product [Paramecium primaurelia]CAD8198516.1 unnamed protein product [Paramecium pentaurelia]